MSVEWTIDKVLVDMSLCSKFKVMRKVLCINTKPFRYLQFETPQLLFSLFMLDLSEQVDKRNAN